MGRIHRSRRPHNTVSRRPLVETVEPRLLFAYDLAFVSATTTPGEYQPGQQISVDFTFANNGDTASPETNFFLYLQTENFDGGGGDEGDGDGDNTVPPGYGGTLFDSLTSGDVFTGLPIPPLAPGETRTLTFARPVGTFVFNGGPYQIAVFAGFGDDNVFQDDANPTNNFGFSAPLITIINSLDPFGGGSSVPDAVVGELDTSFGDNRTGIRSSNLGIGNVQTLATTFDPLTGTQYALASRATDLVLLRFDTSGALDTTFGGPSALSPGLLPLATGTSPITSASLLRAADGSFFASATRAGDASSLVAKFNSSGALDASFGTAGLVTSFPLISGGSFTLASIAFGPAGTVYAVGSTGSVGSRDAAIVRLTSAGSIDTSFYGVNQGNAVFDLGSDDVFSTITVNPDNSVILAGSSGSRAVAIRLGVDGFRDLRFGTRGLFTQTLIPGRDERFTVSSTGPRGSVYLAGYSAAADGSSSTAFVLRLARNGRADSGFGRRGAVLLNLGSTLASPNTLLPSNDGGVLVSAQIADSLSAVSNRSIGAAIARLDAKGKLVTNFGTNGVSRILLPGIPPAAAGDTAGGFADFLASRDGATTVIPGGKIRSIATDTSDSASTIKNAQLLADGSDLSPAFPKPVSSRIKAGARSSVSVRLSNLGTLPASGTLSMSVTIVPVNAGFGQAGATIGSASARVSLTAGSSRNQSVRVSYPRSASGLYTLTARIVPGNGITDIGSTNNSASAPNQLTIAGALPRPNSLMLPPTLIRITPEEPAVPAITFPRSPFIAAPASPQPLSLVSPNDDLFSDKPIV